VKGGRRRRPRRAGRFQGHLKQRDVGSSKLGGVARHGSARRPVHAGWLISWLHPEDIDRARGVHTRAPPPADADSHPLSRVAARTPDAPASRALGELLWACGWECPWAAPPPPPPPPPSGHALTQGQMPRRHLDSGWGRVHHRDVRCTRTRDTALNDPCHSIKPILSCCSSSSSSPAAANAGGARPTVPFRHDLEQAFLYFYYTADDAHTNTPRCLYCYPHIMILPTLYMYI
jgi:hypothetical protein